MFRPFLKNFCKKKLFFSINDNKTRIVEKFQAYKINVQYLLDQTAYLGIWSSVCFQKRDEIFNKNWCKKCSDRFLNKFQSTKTELLGI